MSARYPIPGNGWGSWSRECIDRVYNHCGVTVKIKKKPGDRDRMIYLDAPTDTHFPAAIDMAVRMILQFQREREDRDAAQAADGNGDGGAAPVASGSSTDPTPPWRAGTGIERAANGVPIVRDAQGQYLRPPGFPAMMPRVPTPPMHPPPGEAKAPAPKAPAPKASKAQAPGSKAPLMRPPLMPPPPPLRSAVAAQEEEEPTTAKVSDFVVRNIALQQSMLNNLMLGMVESLREGSTAKSASRIPNTPPPPGQPDMRVPLTPPLNFPGAPPKAAAAVQDLDADEEFPVEVEDDEEFPVEVNIEEVSEDEVEVHLAKRRNVSNTGVREITIFSVSLEDLGFDSNHRSNRNWTQRLDDEVTREFQRLKPEHTVHFFMDCRPFFDDHWRARKGHTGELTESMEAIVGSQPKFAAWMEKLKNRFRELEVRHNVHEQFGIGMVCKAGINRSVSCARICHGLFTRLGYNVQVVHLSKFKWIQRRICLGTCADCRQNPNNVARAKVFENALKMWFDIDVGQWVHQ